jgi:hypothetical protein
LGGAIAEIARGAFGRGLAFVGRSLVVRSGLVSGFFDGGHQHRERGALVVLHSSALGGEVDVRVQDSGHF